MKIFPSKYIQSFDEGHSTKCPSFSLCVLLTIALAYFGAIHDLSAQQSKYEFRGAWMHTVFQEQYLKNTSLQNKEYITTQLDKLKSIGINAIIFQVRPQADAFYQSDIEPWSIYLTNEGKAPVPFWDPLEFIVEETHRRGMELHAWLNPYRVTSTSKQKLSSDHLYYKHPERFVKYGGKIYFNPGNPENVAHITNVVCDIVKRYDIDAIHMDDYFYPYPIKGIPFQDNKTYTKYGKGKTLDDWRRDNVNNLIKILNQKIKSIKPWVRFGVSPFGIWRNKKSDSRGSDTNGLENFDSLYADVLFWVENGWVDYVIPQLYWAIEHPAASYKILADWWNDNINNRHLFIGQDIKVTMSNKDVDQGSTHQNQLKSKLDIANNLVNVNGNCWWPGYSLTDNTFGIADSLSCNHYTTIALPPTYPWIDFSKSEPVNNLRFEEGELIWDSERLQNNVADAIRFVVYRFDNEDYCNFEDPRSIVALTGGHSYKPIKAGVYCVTSLNRVNNESFPSDFITIE